MPPDLLTRICNLPRDRRSQHKSSHQLLQEAGFYESAGAITRRDVAAVLRKDTTLVEDWLTWSGDKRTSSGRYLLPDGRVGHCPGGQEVHHPDIVDACAVFILYELSEFRKLGS